MDYQEVVELLKNANRSNDMVGILPKSDISKVIVHAMQELREYKQLGALEEIREAVEKQRAKKPNNVEAEGYRCTDTYRCPTCGGNFSGTGIADYCYHCGQRLNWE